MKTNNVQGRNFALIVGCYLIIKAIVNMAIGGGFNIADLLLAVVMTCMLFTGLQFVNYAVAGIMVIIALVHLPDNISNFSSNWFYLLEGIIDIGLAAVLVVKSDIKEHFTNKWSEIQDLFSK